MFSIPVVCPNCKKIGACWRVEGVILIGGWEFNCQFCGYFDVASDPVKNYPRFRRPNLP